MTEIETGLQFRTTFKMIGEHTRQKFSKVLKETAIAANWALVLGNPKKTYWSSEHWSTMVNMTSESVPRVTDPLANLKPGDVIHIFNNVGYVDYLEEGSSPQRPNGFMYLGINEGQKTATLLGAKLSKERLNV